MAVAVETSNGTNSGAGNFTHTGPVVTAANLILVIIGTGHSPGGTMTLSALTYDGVSILTNTLWDVTDGNFCRCMAFYLKSPPTGAKSVAGTFSANDQYGVVVVGLTGADVAGTTFGTAATNSGTSGTTAAVSVTSSSGFVVGGLMSDDEAGPTGGGGTLINNQGPISSDTYLLTKYYTTTNPTVSWTQVSNGFAVAGVGVNAPSAAISPDKWLTAMDRPPIIQKTIICY